MKSLLLLSVLLVGLVLVSCQNEDSDEFVADERSVDAQLDDTDELQAQSEERALDDDEGSQTDAVDAVKESRDVDDETETPDKRTTGRYCACNSCRWNKIRITTVHYRNMRCVPRGIYYNYPCRYHNRQRCRGYGDPLCFGKSGKCLTRQYNNKYKFVYINCRGRNHLVHLHTKHCFCH